MPLFSTHYCKTCCACYKETDGTIRCFYHDREMTEKQIKHTNTCSHFCAEQHGIDLTTGKAYKPNRRKYKQTRLIVCSE